MYAAPACRFTAWSANVARLFLVAVAAIVLFAAMAMPSAQAPARIDAVPVSGSTMGEASAPQRDADLLLYDSIVERVAAGENYYDAAIAEQRARSFPVRPGFAVRPPTLAAIQGWIGPAGTMSASLLLVAAIGFAWWRRFKDEGSTPSQRRCAVALTVAGASFLLNPDYHVLHELWAGGLIALSLGLHRPGKWGAALAVAALALAIRELVLPFVLLMGAMAAWRRDWKEASAWGALVLCFAALLGWHHAVVAGHGRPGDLAGPSWLGLRGAAGWIGNVVHSSQLHLLPHAIGGPVLVAALLGWAGRRTAAGATAILLLLGYGLAFMIAGRDNNFYWGLIITPMLFAGLAFVPMSLRDLWQAARHSRQP
jgi:hypothetical protein